MTGQTTWNELVSQPDAWSHLIARLDRGDGVPPLSLKRFDDVVLVGSGTSYYLALAGMDWVRRRYAVPVRAVPSCEVMLDPIESRPTPGRRRLVVAISRSGESSELVRAVELFQAAGDTVLGVSCAAGSSLLQLADWPFLIGEGHEDGLVMLRSFTSMLIAIQYLFGSDVDRAVLRHLPAAGRAALDHGEAVRVIVNRRVFDRFVFLASGSSYPLALEASLKVQEMSIATSEAYHSLEYRHGPKATADERTLVTLFALRDPALGVALAHDVKALGATLLVIGADSDDYEGIADMVFARPDGFDDGPANTVNLLPAQILAFEHARRCGKDPDAPVNLNKVVLL